MYEYMNLYLTLTKMNVNLLKNVEAFRHLLYFVLD